MIADTALRATIRARLDELTAGREFPGELSEGMAHALRGGKLLRPCLLIRTAEEYGRRDGATLDFACALELIHTASLVHDDLPCIDNDRLRRGQASNFARYGEAAAVLQGDALVNLGYRVLLDAAASPEDLRAARYIARMAGAEGMLAGQYEDVALTGSAAQPAELDRIHLRKTAKMFAAAFCGGALLAGLDDVSDLERRALTLGRAFQIADDLIDAGRGVATAGKTLGKDAAAGKNTYVSLYGIEGARETLGRLLTQARGPRPAVLNLFADFIADSIV